MKQVGLHVPERVIVERYKYGADADGNRWEWRTDIRCPNCEEELTEESEQCPYCEKALIWDLDENDVDDKDEGEDY